MRTFIATKENVRRSGILSTQEAKLLARLASEVAKILSGKNKPSYSPSCDNTGDYVVVINTSKTRTYRK